MEDLYFGKYNELVAAIIKQAEKDLKRAIKRNEYAKANALKKWFLSDYGQYLSVNHGETILQRIEREMRQHATNT